MTQIGKHQLANNSLTGASFNRGFKFYDETENVLAGEVRLWNACEYIALNNITGTTEGDLSNAPDVSSDWEQIKPAIYRITPSAQQTFTNARITLNFDTVNVPNNDFVLSSGEITFLKDGIYIISLTTSVLDSSGTSRSGANIFVQIDEGAGYSDVDIKLSTYNRTSAASEDTASITFPYKISAGSKLRIRLIRYTGNDVLATIPEGCSLSIFTVSGGIGPKGDIGPQGADGDITWNGVFNSSNTYLPNMAVEHQGSSYVCIANNPAPSVAPPDNSYWDILAQKGTDGSGASLNISDSGSSIPNTPHSTLNFTGDITATDSGSGIANINVTIPKNTYIVPIWAEENAALGTSNPTYEWAYGNGANTPNDGGLTVYVPSGYKCELVAMSLRIGSGTATVQLVYNGMLQGGTYDVTVSSGQSATNEFASPLQINNNDYINFATSSSSGSSGPNVVTAWLKYEEL